MRTPAFVAALALAALVPAGLAAHVQVATTAPAAGTTAKAPKSVSITFDKPVDHATAAASIVMTAMPGMPNHGEMAIRNFTPAWGADGKTLTLTLRKPLPAGTYDLRWQAAGADGHKVSGTVTFTVN